MPKIKVFYTGSLHTECVHESGAKVLTDAPKDNMGKGETFSPTDLFAASLGSCMVTLMAIAAHKLGIDLKETTAEVEKEMSSAGSRRIGKLVIRIRSPSLPNPIAREKLEKAAIDCPVHLSLHPDIKVELDFVWGL